MSGDGEQGCDDAPAGCRQGVSNGLVGKTADGSDGDARGIVACADGMDPRQQARLM